MVTYDGTTLRLFVNGSYLDSTTDGRSIPALTIAPMIGRANYGATNAFAGQIGHVAVYNRKLSQREAQAHHALGLTPP